MNIWNGVIRPSVQPNILYPSVRPKVRASVRPTPPVRQPACQPERPPVRPSVHPFIRLSIQFPLLALHVISVCSSLGSSFTKHKDVYVRGYNIWKDKPISLAGCKQQCLQQGENCLSIDYQNNNSKCRLNSISQQDATDAGYLGSEAGDNVYTRDCEN